jgi:uncharacterized RDD family membrane protein YckC
MYFYPMLVLFLLVGGIVTLSIASSWDPQPGKKLFIGFIASFFVALPIFELLLLMLFLISAYSRSTIGVQNFRIFELLYHTNNFMLLTAAVASQMLLVLYAIKRKTKKESTPTPTVDPDRLTTWRTDMTAIESINVLRRREWAFLIDSGPIFLVALVALWGLSGAAYDDELRQGLVYSISMMLEFGLLGYLLFKDSVKGLSLGKRITECRVVDFKTGVAIGPGKSAARNFLYLIPLMALVELAFASTRNDRRRIGDLIAGTIVVTGNPNQIDGVEQVPETSAVNLANQPPVRHALDD